MTSSTVDPPVIFRLSKILSLRAGKRVKLELFAISSISLTPSLPHSHISLTMSDIEDGMDVDVPSKEIQFSSSDNANGKKRTAADLPVEAQDNLPWYGYFSLFWCVISLIMLIGSRNTDPIH